jgi:hypothetical protein
MDPAWVSAGAVVGGVLLTLYLNKQSEQRRAGMLDEFKETTVLRLTKHGEEIDKVKDDLSVVRERVGKVEERCRVTYGVKA